MTLKSNVWYCAGILAGAWMWSKIDLSKLATVTFVFCALTLWDMRKKKREVGKHGT